MKASVNLSLTDYMAIARSVADGRTNEPSTYEVAHQANGHTLYIEVAYDFDAHEERGGSYECYDFESLPVIDGECYDIVRFECLDTYGESVACDFTAKRLLDILN